MKTALYLTTFLLLMSFSITAQIIHVPQDVPTLQAAIDVAADHDTILAAPGEYFENINFSGKNIVVCSNFALSNDRDDILTTIINGSMPLHADTGSCVLIVSGEDSTAVLQGFTITGGTGTRWEDEHGPNHWYTEGGGILIQYSSPVIKDNIIAWNVAINTPSGTTSAGGGGIRCGDGNPRILNNIIANNQGKYGGGIVMNYSGALIRNNLIINNSGGQHFGGGGLWFLYNGEAPLLVENNTIANNASALGGGGIRVWFNNAVLRNNIFWGNTAGTSPQIQGATATVNYCCVEGGFNGEGNIEENPGFVPGTFILSDGSPCIDAGPADEIYYDPADPANPGNALYPAKGSQHNDMGVYGGPGCASLPSLLTRIHEPAQGQQDVEVNVFPNPATEYLSIEIASTDEMQAEIDLCNANSVVRHLGSPRLKPNGRQTLVSDISQLAAGTYFITIRSKGGLQVHKFIKL